MPRAAVNRPPGQLAERRRARQGLLDDQGSRRSVVREVTVASPDALDDEAMPQRLDGHDSSDPQTLVFQTAAPRLIVSTPDIPDNYEFVLDRPGLYTLERGADSDLRIDNPYVSSRHASIRYAGNILTIEDLDSSAGTRCWRSRSCWDSSASSWSSSRS